MRRLIVRATELNYYCSTFTYEGSESEHSPEYPKKGDICTAKDLLVMVANGNEVLLKPSRKEIK